MNKVRISNCRLDLSKLDNVIAIGVFGSYHEKSFIAGKSDIDIMILLEKELDFDEEFQIEDYLSEVLSKYFSYDNLHFTFLSEFNYPFSELLLISKDKFIFNEDKYLDYVLGYSSFKRDREYLELIREENLKDMKEHKDGLL